MEKHPTSSLRMMLATGRLRLGDDLQIEIQDGKFAAFYIEPRDVAVTQREPLSEPRKPPVYAPVSGEFTAYFPGVVAYKVPTREEFEAWITQRGVFGVAKNSRGQYVNAYVRGAWAMRCAIITEFKP